MMNIEKVQAAFNTMFPDPDIQRAVMELLRDYIQEANAISDKSWVVTIYDQLNKELWPNLVFQIRNIYTLSFKTDLSGRQINGLVAFVDRDSLTKEEISVLEQAGCSITPGFKSAPHGKQVQIPLSSKEKFLSVLPIIKRNFPAYIRNTLKPGMQTAFKKIYQSEIVDYINQTFHSEIPHPSYYHSNLQANVTPQILAEILRGGVRTNQTIPISGAFLERCGTALQAQISVVKSDIGSKARTNERKQQFIDRAYFFMTEDQSLQGNPGIGLTIGLWQDKLWWGFSYWSSAEKISRLQQTIERLKLTRSNETVEMGRGALFVPEAFNTGTHYAFGQGINAEQVAAYANIETLIERIIPDLTDLYQRLENHLSEIQRALGVPMTQKITADQLVSSMASNGLHFTPWQVATFYTALQTKGFVILSGISGTGKTKLAQAFARMLPQPATLTVIPEDIIRIPVQPYMRKYSRLVIPKSAVALFTPPDAGQSFDVVLQFDGQKETCMLKHYQYSSTDYIQINLKGKVKNWFLENFSEGKPIALELQMDADGKLNGFRLGEPEIFAQLVATQNDGYLQTYLFLSVRPDWRDSKSLLGFYNPLEQKYQSTPFLEFIKRAAQSYSHQDGLAWFVVLDEMNLARVEYYFADILSVLESGRDQNGYSREPIRLDYPAGAEITQEERELYLPPNLYFIGTVNIDETTHAFSPKVLDRAFTLELTEADFSQYPTPIAAQPLDLDEHLRRSLLDDFSRQGHYAQIEKAEVAGYVKNHSGLRDKLQVLNRSLQPFDLHFGYRVFDEIAAYLANAEMNGLYRGLSPAADPFDAAVLMKVLPKFHGSRSKLEEPLKILLAWCLNPLAPELNRIEEVINDQQSSVGSLIQKLGNLPYFLPYTAGRVIRMIRALYTTGFAAFG
jgi:5-methylcytosine-specific restriction enzyme B